MKYQAILFDLDGTLIDTVPDLADAANAMRQDLDMPILDDEIIGTYIGKGFENMMLRVLAHDLVTQDNAATAVLSNLDQQQLDPDLITRGMLSFRRHYHELNGTKSHLYPDVVAGLDKFKEMGAKLAVVTNKSTEFTSPLLEKMGILHYFEQIICGDTCARKKPHPMPILHACSLLDVDSSQALFIGDSINDALAAQAAGVDMLILPYGYNEGQSVQNLPANAIVDTILLAAIWAKRQKS